LWSKEKWSDFCLGYFYENFTYLAVKKMRRGIGGNIAGATQRNIKKQLCKKVVMNSDFLGTVTMQFHAYGMPGSFLQHLLVLAFGPQCLTKGFWGVDFGPFLAPTISR
jgi:hypothetical protein